MRTTVRLSKQLAAEAKRAALRDGTTLTALIEKGLRLVLRAPKQSPAKRKMPRISKASGRQLADTTKTSRLLDILDQELPLEKRK